LAVLLREALLKSLITFCLIDMGVLRRKEPCYRYEFTPNNNTDCENQRLVKCLTLWFNIKADVGFQKLHSCWVTKSPNKPIYSL